MTKNDKHILILSSWLPSKKHPFLGNFVIRQAELLAKNYRVTIINCIESATINQIECTTSSSAPAPGFGNLPKPKTLAALGGRHDTGDCRQALGSRDEAQVQGNHMACLDLS